MSNDWSVTFNEDAQRKLDVDLVHTLSHDSVVCCIRFSPDGKFVATGCNKSATIYNAATGECFCILRDEVSNDSRDMYVRAVCFSPDGNYLATGSEDGIVRVWDIRNRTIQKAFPGHKGDIYALDFASDGETIATGGADNTVRVWDVETGKTEFTFTIEDAVTSIAISHDSAYVAAGSLNNSVRVWDTQKGTLVEHLSGPDGHTDSVYSVAFSSDGKELFSGSLDKTAKVWKLSSPSGTNYPLAKGGKCLRTFKGHTDLVIPVALTPDNSWLLTGSKDRCVQIWDPATGHAQLKLKAHNATVLSIAVSSAEAYFATGSGDKTARIWSYKSANQ